MRGCSLGEAWEFSVASSLKSSGQRNDMTSKHLGCYMENGFRIWKLIRKRLQCKEELRHFLPVPTYFSFMGSFFQPWTSVDILREGVDQWVWFSSIYQVSTLEVRRLFNVTGFIGVPRHLNMMTWKARSLRTPLIQRWLYQPQGKSKDRNAHG